MARTLTLSMFLVSVAVLTSQPAAAQYPVTFGGAGGEFVSALAMDDAGNTYVGGHITGTVDFDPGAGTSELSASAATGTGFLASYANDGTFRWAIHLGGERTSTGASTGGANDIEVGPDGEIYVTGTYDCSTCDFDPGAGTVAFPPAVAGVFVASYTTEGSFRYAFPLNNSGQANLAGGLAVDGSGTIHVTGGFRGTIDFDPGAGDATMGTAGGSRLQAFVATYDASGQYLSAFILAGTSAAYAQDIGSDSAGNITVVGGFAGALDLDPGTGTNDVMPRGNNEDTFVASYTPAGAFRWGHTVGGDTNRGFGADAVVDEAGNVYVVGPLIGSADFDPGPGVAVETSAGLGDAYLVAYDASGAFRFVVRVGAGGNDGAQDVAFDSNGNVVVTGTFFNTIDLDPGAGTASVMSNGVVDMFLAGYAPDGQFVYGLSVGGTSLDGGSVVAGGPIDGLMAVGGFFRETVDFDPAPGDTAERTGAGESDGFVALYNISGMVSTLNEEGAPTPASAFSMMVYPNPSRGTASLQFDLPEALRVAVVLYDALGRRVATLHDNALPAGSHTLALDREDLPNGVYLVRAETETGTVTRRLTLVR